MKFIKIKPAKHNDMKSKIIKEYMDPERGLKYKAINPDTVTKA